MDAWSVPGSQDVYKRQHVDGFDIYVNNMLKFKDDTMKIVFSSYLFSKKVAVDGYDYSE